MPRQSFEHVIEVEIASDKPALVAEVVSSAVRLLILLKFDNVQIADVFESAAVQLRHNQLGDNDGSGPIFAEEIAPSETEDSFDLWQLNSAAEDEEFFKQITRSMKRINIVDLFERPSEIEHVTTLYHHALANLAEAQSWYREQCNINGVIFEVSRDEWASAATDDMLDKEDEIVFLTRCPSSRLQSIN